MSLIYEPSDDSYFFRETLEKEISELVNKNIDLKLLEIGSGSGIQLKKLGELGVKNIFGSDINGEAVAHCKELGLNVRESDLFEKISGNFNVILFNPPYLPEDGLEDEESSLATTGGENGSEIINEFLKQAKEHLTKDGTIFLLTSSLTKDINWLDYKKELIAEKKLFFETLLIWKLWA